MTHAPNPKSILIVDDSEDLLMLLSTVFEHLHFRVEVANNALDALEKINTTKVDFVLSDIEMSPKNGLWLLENSKKQRPDLPVGLMSSAADKYYSDGMELGAVTVLKKPVDVSLVNRMVSSASAAH